MSRTAVIRFKSKQACRAFQQAYEARTTHANMLADATVFEGSYSFAGDAADRAADVANEIAGVTCAYKVQP